MEVWLPVVWFGVIGFGVLMYVLLDGFVLASASLPRSRRMSTSSTT